MVLLRQVPRVGVVLLVGEVVLTTIFIRGLTGGGGGGGGGGCTTTGGVGFGGSTLATSGAFAADSGLGGSFFGASAASPGRGRFFSVVVSSGFSRRRAAPASPASAAHSSR